MITRKLGSAGPEVSGVGLGCMGMSEFYGPSDDADSCKLIHEAIARGINFFDTADMYGPFKNEELLGRALKGQRGQAIVATKFGIVRDEQGGWHGVCGRPGYIKTACDASLRRLKMDHIDLYYQHRIDPSVPIEESVGAMGDLVKAGKIRFVGLSEAAVHTIRRAHREYPITALQTELKTTQKQLEATKGQLALAKADILLSQAEAIGEFHILIAQLDGVDPESLKTAAEQLQQKLTNGAVVLGSVPEADKVSLVAAFSPAVIQKGLQAGKLVGAIAKLTGGGGGGRPNLAQAGGRDASKLGEALAEAKHQLISGLS